MSFSIYIKSMKIYNKENLTHDIVKDGEDYFDKVIGKKLYSEPPKTLFEQWERKNDEPRSIENCQIK